ncbi:MAG: metallophosphoesterase [Deltaproteobacteria bacterium]|nr:metallophosphoesterase [Deltaproteobacteria bacterium]
MMRIVHATDVHWYSRPHLGEIRGKRILGTANLFLRGRRHEFTDAAQRALIDHIVSLAPDLFVLTGDLTAQALPRELDKARRALEPVLSAFPSLVLPGNHDVYTWEGMLRRDFEARFGPWLHRDDAGLARLDRGEVTVLGLDAARPSVASAGRVPDAQLERLARVLEDEALRARFVVLAMHYPLLDEEDQPNINPIDGLLDAERVIATLADARVRPQLILHGHIHRGRQTTLRLPDGVGIPSINCGASGRAFDPVLGRTASMAVYEVEADGLRGIQRYRFDGRRFQPVPG